MAKLVCQTGPTAGHEYPLTKDLTVFGRQGSCDIQVLDNMASRAHCQVRRDGRLFSLVDLGSRNGTKLNGKKASERLLSFGDRIAIGDIEYLFVKETGDQDLSDLLTKYEVLEKVGEGGMGIVYKAIQRSMARTVALKILSPKYSQRPKFVEQFIREARAAGALNHPNIIQVHEVGTENDIHFFSMEFIDGPTCTQVLKSQGALESFEALEIIRQVTKALEYAHEHRLIHQDIKPDNIMIGANNTVKLADLGISKTFDEAEADQGAKRVMGTPHYMAPEAAMGKKVDQRIDIYSLGATLYHLLAGRTPFSATSATAVLRAQVMDPPPPLHEFKPDIPDVVCRLVDRMMAKKPEDRFQNAAEVMAEIERLQASGDFNRQRPSGESSISLNRLSHLKRNRNSDVGQTPTDPHTADASSMARRHEQHRQHILIGIAVGSVLLLLLVLMIVLKKPVDQSLQTAVEPNPGTRPTNPDPDPNPDPKTLQRQKWQQELFGFEEKLRQSSSNIDLATIKTRVMAIRDADKEGGLSSRITDILDTIDKIAVQQRTAKADQDFQALSKSVLQLMEERNYELALQRLDGFEAKDETGVKNRWANLRTEVTRSSETYIGNLRSRIQRYKLSKNMAGLKELRDQLPASLVNSDVAKEANAAIAELQKDEILKHQGVAKDAAAALKMWDFPRLDEVHRTNRTLLEKSPVKAQVEGFVATGRKLSEYILAMETTLNRYVERKLRFQGTLDGNLNPEIDGADKDGLHLIIGGGILTVKWVRFKADDLLKLTSQVLGEKEVATYAEAFKKLTEAVTLAEAQP